MRSSPAVVLGKPKIQIDRNLLEQHVGAHLMRQPRSRAAHSCFVTTFPSDRATDESWSGPGPQIHVGLN
jgi:hypothetical protein